MPKVVLTESQRDKESVESILKKYAGEQRLTLPDLAKKSNIKTSTFYKRIQSPDDFKRGELRRVCKVLRIPYEEQAVLWGWVVGKGM